MKKVILFENRPERQKIYLPKGSDDVEWLNTFEFLTLYNEKEHDQLILKGDFEFLKTFDLLIFHRSYLIEFKNGSKLGPIYNFCKQESKDLILFTGGVSGSTFIKDLDFQSLTISAKEFYTNLLDFLPAYSSNKGSTNLLELKYGKKWEAMTMLQLRELLTLRKLGEIEDLSKIDQNIDNLADILGLSGLVLDQEKLLNDLNIKIKQVITE